MFAESPTQFTLTHHNGMSLLRLISRDGLNRLSLSLVQRLTEAIFTLSAKRTRHPLIIFGEKCFSTGADLHEIVRLDDPEAMEFSRTGQALMNAVDGFPAPVCAAVSSYCMGGGLDLALACDLRIAAPHALFGHRGAALGLITGWGGTQRLPRLIGKARALQMFTAAEKVSAAGALRIGLVHAIAVDPVREAERRLSN